MEKTSRLFEQAITRLFGQIVGRKIFFLHLPKCAGTSVRDSLRRQFRWSGVFQRATVVELHYKTLYEVAVRSGEEQDVTSRRLLDYFLAHPHSRLVMGHFGLSDSLWESHRESWEFVTLLRHPVERFLSHFYYNKKRQREFLRIEGSLEEFVQTDRGRSLGSLYVQYLTGNSPEECRRSSVVNTAVERLNSFTLCGRLEELSLFETRYRKLFGVSLDLAVSNETAGRPSRQELAPALRRRLEEICEPDITLFESLDR